MVGSTPTINDSPPQDRNQPRSLATPTFKILAAPPRTAQCLLHDILGIVTIAHQPISDTIQCRGVFVDQDDKVCPRKRHPCLSPLAVPRDNRWQCRDALYVSHAGYRN